MAIIDELKRKHNCFNIDYIFNKKTLEITKVYETESDYYERLFKNGWKQYEVFNKEIYKISAIYSLTRLYKVNKSLALEYMKRYNIIIKGDKNND